jgi:DNA-binding NarL/FixJ family response regulator
MPRQLPITRIFIADARPMSVAGIAHLISEAPEFRACGHCHTASDLPLALSRARAHLAIVDTELYDRDAQRAVQILRALDPAIAILLVAGRVEETLLMAIADLSVSCISPYSDCQDILPALRALIGGRRTLPFDVQVALTSRLAQPRSSLALSSREREILRLAASGLTVERIGATLHISPHTAKTHLRKGYGKLRARNRSQAIATAMKQGLL